MSPPVYALLLLNFVAIGLLPRIFFRKDGSFNLMWWVTATPFFAVPLVLTAGVAGYLDPVTPGAWRGTLEVVAVVPGVASIALIFLTLGTHRIPIALWHQEDDAPRNIVTYGAYRLIRHPFYSSFLLGFAAACIAFPHWLTFLMALYTVVQLNLTAAREERRLSASEFGAEYREYVMGTGRFVPRLSPRRQQRMATARQES
ncbi:MAG: putative protein-S-isoprenylcysteine methyltransferase-like protein [Sphaerisporangium sp.]|nr:putative protein-S-isoprenylcysteine methyltransferase-like protein [Sphaerisporangium sp.]